MSEQNTDPHSRGAKFQWWGLGETFTRDGNVVGQTRSAVEKRKSSRVGETRR